jgi:hypothetical protein
MCSGPEVAQRDQQARTRQRPEVGRTTVDPAARTVTHLIIEPKRRRVTRGFGGA